MCNEEHLVLLFFFSILLMKEKNKQSEVRDDTAKPKHVIPIEESETRNNTIIRCSHDESLGPGNAEMKVIRMEDRRYPIIF
jgi:hypothetical protein